MNKNDEVVTENAVHGSWAHLSRTVERILAKSIAWAWRLRSDRQAIASLLGRSSAHLSILLLTLLVLLLGRVTFAQISIANEAPPLQAVQAVAEPEAVPTANQVMGFVGHVAEAPTSGAITRQALPHTSIPDRVRLEVITYTVQTGDTVFGIAQGFGLSPYTIVWSNMETLQGAPWLLTPGTTLFIPPVDGAYHIVMEGETPSDIADTYDVEMAALYNMWNDVEPGQTLREGQILVVPGATGEDFDWEPPPPPPPEPGRMVAAASSYDGAVDVSMTGADASFMLPTGSYAVSGWVFRDARNPGHIGLDYRCRLGDPLYASDGAIVKFSGWSGGYGNLVILDHGNGFTTRYGHFNRIYVQAGQFVPQGTVLGECGTTGWSSGPHLHYEIRYNGVPQNPKIYEP
jgi:murein DD-endopeptidase MepM/ murein hydrolase activator NlpD